MVVVRRRSFGGDVDFLPVCRHLIADRQVGCQANSRAEAKEWAAQMLAFLRDPHSGHCWFDVNSGEELKNKLIGHLCANLIPPSQIGTSNGEIYTLAECWQRPAVASS